MTGNRSTITDEPSTLTIRDTGPYSTRNASKGAMIAETGIVFSALANDRTVDAVEVPQGIIAEFGAENVVTSMANPMPGSDPESELGQLWIKAMANAVQARLAERGPGKPVVSLERMAALPPAAGPRGVMQRL